MNEKLPPPPPSTMSPPLPLPPIDTDGASAYHITAAQVPLEFGGTLKSSKGSKNSSNQHSPQLKKSRRNGSSVAHDRSYCTCFGSCGYGNRCQRNQISMPFWPAVLANLGICALLVGYIFIGSFVFLTIENSDGRVVGLDPKAAASWRAQHSAQMPQIIHQHQNQQSKKDNGTKSSTSGFNGIRNARDVRAPRHLAKSTTTSTATPDVSTYIKRARADDKMQRFIVSAAAADDAVALDYDLQTLPMTDAAPASVLNADAIVNTDFDEEDYIGDDALAYDGASMEDVERQRTVENIWDITVSLNILYKENWTRLAALEIAKFQDQLVKRLVMDLTLSTANGATQSTATATAAHGRNVKQQQQQRSNSLGNDAGAAGLGSYERQRFWQLQNTQQRQHQWSSRRSSRGGVGGGGQHARNSEQFEWNFATAFLYSMTVITTVGYGTITPRTTLGRMVTIGYATLGIPLTLIYLSSIGSVLSKLVRFCCMRTRCGVCCCQQQSNNGSNSIFSRHPQVADRKTDLKLKHFQQPQQQQPLPYCYVRPPATTATEMEMQQQQQQQLPPPTAGSSVGGAFDNLSVATSVTEPTRHAAAAVLSWQLAAPVAFCVLLLIVYVSFGALVFAILEDWPLIDGIYFCFMSLSTIGFCDLLPGVGIGSDVASGRSSTSANFVIWFCAAYILSGLTLTSFCVNLLHDEIATRMRVVFKFEKVHELQKERHDAGFYSARS